MTNWSFYTRFMIQSQNQWWEIKISDHLNMSNIHTLTMEKNML